MVILRTHFFYKKIMCSVDLKESYKTRFEDHSLIHNPVHFLGSEASLMDTLKLVILQEEIPDLKDESKVSYKLNV
jgi:hypothetical protein